MKLKIKIELYKIIFPFKNVITHILIVGITYKKKKKKQR